MGYVLLGVGVLILAIGLFEVVRLLRFLGRSKLVEGRVVGFEEQTSTDSDGDRTSSTHAVVQYSASGSSVKFTEKSQTMGGLSEGDTVPVKYEPGFPQKARIATGGRLWLRPGIIVVTGLGLAIAGVVTL